MELNAPSNLRAAVGGIGGRLLYWEYAERIKRAMKWNFRSTVELHNRFAGKALILCGGGPSLKDCVPQIRELQRQGGLVLTVNKTHDFLLGLDEPIVPWAHVLLDPMPWVADYTKMVRPGVLYLVASSCDPAVARRIKLAGGKVYLWHGGADFYGEAMPGPILEAEFSDKNWDIVVGKTTVGLRSVVLCYQLGFRMFHMFGFDSSMARNDNGEFNLHAYPKARPEDSEEGWVTLNVGGQSWQFYTNSHMSRQVIDFEDMCEEIGELMRRKAWQPVDFRVYGDGLLPAFAASIGLHANPLMNQKYSGRIAA